MTAIEFQIGGNDKVLLRSYEYGYEICWQRSQKGAVVWTPEKYYGSVEHALQKIMELKIKVADIRSLTELKSAIEKARQEAVETWHVRPDMAG